MQSQPKEKSHRRCNRNRGRAEVVVQGNNNRVVYHDICEGVKIYNEGNYFEGHGNASVINGGFNMEKADE